MITATKLSKNYGTQLLFSDVDLQLNKGNSYGIVGANGSGKSTLLRILSEAESSDSGEITIPKSARMGILDQDHFQYENTPILHVAMMGHKSLWTLLKKQEEMCDGTIPFDADEYAELDEQLLLLNGYAFEAKASEILEGLNIPTSKHLEPLSTLSGGYKLRALLGQVLASNPDILILDEPTNHLDIISIHWLEGFLQSYQGLTLVVSHDHRFLNTVCTHIVDVDYETVTSYRGNYERFMIQKQEERTRREKEILKREREIEDHKDFIRRFKAKATKARQANSRVKRMEKIEIEELPQSSRRFPLFTIEKKRASGKKILDARHITKSYDENTVLDNISFTIGRDEKVAIIGPNGIGKSTLLKILMDEVKADQGSAEWGHEAHLGYFAQDHKAGLGNPKSDVLSCFWESCPLQPIGYCYGKLAEVLFSREETTKKIENLSGGEAARLLLSKIATKKPNVLILDEPTNHLDLESISSLGDALCSYTGSIIFVSHDRWLVNKVATRIIEITETGVESYMGTYEEFMHYKESKK